LERVNSFVFMRQPMRRRQVACRKRRELAALHIAAVAAQAALGSSVSICVFLRNTYGLKVEIRTTPDFSSEKSVFICGEK